MMSSTSALPIWNGAKRCMDLQWIRAGRFRSLKASPQQPKSRNVRVVCLQNFSRLAHSGNVERWPSIPRATPAGWAAPPCAGSRPTRVWRRLVRVRAAPSESTAGRRATRQVHLGAVVQSLGLSLARLRALTQVDFGAPLTRWRLAPAPAGDRGAAGRKPRCGPDGWRHQRSGPPQPDDATVLRGHAADRFAPRRRARLHAGGKRDAFFGLLIRVAVQLARIP